MPGRPFCRSTVLSGCRATIGLVMQALESFACLVMAAVSVGLLCGEPAQHNAPDAEPTDRTDVHS